MQLDEYLSNGIASIMAKAYRNVLSNPHEAKFAFKMQRLFEKSAKRRKEILEKEGLEVPPFLISSIATTCNLHCKGCYARSNGIANDNADEEDKGKDDAGADSLVIMDHGIWSAIESDDWVI